MANRPQVKCAEHMWSGPGVTRSPDHDLPLSEADRVPRGGPQTRSHERGTRSSADSERDMNGSSSDMAASTRQCFEELTRRCL